MFGYTFPAIRGIQARREYFVSMCPMRLIPKLFLFDEDELVPELRAQRRLTRGRLPEIARYMVDGRDKYTFSALTASVDGDLKFEPLGLGGSEGQHIGLLHIPMSARFVINDGQHRRAAIEMAMKEDPSLADESIAVVFFVDIGLERCQQMFADLNRYAIRTTKSLGVLYDHRDRRAQAVKLFVLRNRTLKDLVELERSTLSPRSRKLLTLSALYHATVALLDGHPAADVEEASAAAEEFWLEVVRHLPEWQAVFERRMTAGEVRRDFIHSHGVALQALGRVGNALFRSGEPWKKRLRRIRTIDWQRSNASTWEGRAMIGGRVSKAGHNVTLTVNALKAHLELDLTPEEQRVEDAFSRRDRG